MGRLGSGRAMTGFTRHRWRTLGAQVAVVLACLARESGAAGFEYPDFNHTQGLVLNGRASTSSCEERGGVLHQDQPAYGYQPKHGTADPPVELVTMHHLGEGAATVTVSTDKGTDKDAVGVSEASFGHRDEAFRGGYASSASTDCAVRLRLTPAQPDSVGSVWRGEPAQVLQGFSSTFSVQFSDLSRTCNVVRDASFSTHKYRSCAVHGGDGLAFVVHGDESGTGALGLGAEQLGFGGFRNALAVELDVWYNPDLGDLLEDHVTVFAGGDAAVSASHEFQLHQPRKRNLADGRVHQFRVVYFPFLKLDLAPFFATSAHSIAFAKDNGEGHRLGTLGVWVDGETDPLVAIPINLSVALSLPDDRAIVGFTAATGRSWAVQEVVAWRFCESHDDTQCDP